MTAFVTTSGNLGLFLKADVPLSIRVMLEGKVKGNVINVAIPPQIQEPLPNVPSAIEALNFSLNGKTKVKGKYPRRHRVHRLLGWQVDAEVPERHDRRLAERLEERQLQEVEKSRSSDVSGPRLPVEAGAACFSVPPQFLAMTGRWTLLGAPLDSSGASRGEERAPQLLRDAGWPSGSAWRMPEMSSARSGTPSATRPPA